jgi:hypothetical protein
MVDYKCPLVDETGQIQDGVHFEVRSEAKAAYLLGAPTSTSHMDLWNNGHLEKVSRSKRELDRHSRRGTEITQAEHLARAATEAPEHSDPHAWDVVS